MRNKYEHCGRCGNETGRAGESDDSIYINVGEEYGPICEDCYDMIRQVTDRWFTSRSLNPKRGTEKANRVSQMKFAEAELSTLRAENERLKGQCVRWEAQYEGSLAERAGHEGENERLQARLKELEAELFEARQAALREGISAEEYKAELGVWESRETFWDETNKKLEAERDLQHGRAEAYHNEAVKYRDQVANLSLLLQKMSEKNQDLRAENVRLEGVVKEMLNADPRQLWNVAASELKSENDTLRTNAYGNALLCAKYEQLQAQLKENAEAYSKYFVQLHRDVAERDEEIEQLKDWKESSIKIEESWDIQRVGKLMGLLLGQDIRSNIEPYILRINAEIDGLKHWHKTADLRSAEIVRLREALVDINNIQFDLPAKIYIYDKMKAIAKKALGGGE